MDYNEDLLLSVIVYVGRHGGVSKLYTSMATTQTPLYTVAMPAAP